MWPGTLSGSYRIVIPQNAVKLLQAIRFRERTFHGPTPSARPRGFEDPAPVSPLRHWTGLTLGPEGWEMGCFGKILLVFPEYILMPLHRGWNCADF